MIYKMIENLSRIVLEWAISKQISEQPIINEIQDKFSYHCVRTERARKALL